MMTRAIVVVLISSLSTLAASAELRLERAVTLRHDAQVWSSRVCVGDVAIESWISVRCPSSDARCCPWKIENEEQTLSPSEIEKGFAATEIPGVQVAIANLGPIQVARVGRELSRQEIENEAAKALSERTRVSESDIKIRQVQLLQPIYVSNAQPEWKLVLPETLGPKILARITKAGDSSQVLGTVSMEVEAYEEIYVAKSTLRPGTEVSEGAFATEKRPILAPNLNPNAFIRKGSLPVGMTTRVTLLDGQALMVSAIEKTPSVRLGDVVTLLLRSDSLRVSTKGIAQGNAAVGDLVTVQLQRYNRSFRGKLCEGRVVEVWL